MSTEKQAQKTPWGTLICCIIAAVGFESCREWAEKEHAKPVNVAARNLSTSYGMAIEFVKRRYPGAEKFTPEKEARIWSTNNTFYVDMQVDGKNQFGGPVRQTMIVAMERAGDDWKLVDLLVDGK